MNRFKRSQSVHQKIIIIGAGAAGIAAATRLLENGFNDLIILEAENRIGGRIHTIRCDDGGGGGGGCIELGAQWCHGEVDNVVYQLVKDLNVLSSTQTFNDNQFYSSDGRCLNKRLTDKIVEIVEQIFDDIDETEIKATTYGEYFNIKYNAKIKEEFGDDREAGYIADYLKEWFHKFLNSLNGTINWHEISPKEHYQKCEGDQLLNWQDKGFHTIIDILTKKFPAATKQSPIDDKLFLNKEVTRIIWDDNIINENGVTVECADGSSYNGDHVIVTVSLGVLKKFYRNFIPELPKQKQSVIEHLGFGVVGKILLKFPEQWWPTNSQGFSVVWNDNDRKQIVNEFPYGPVKDGRSWLEDIFGFYAIDSHPRFLLGWIVGEMVADVERLSDDLVQDGCMYLLRKVAGGSCKIPEPDAIFRSKWTTDPHFLGCYSFVGCAAEQAQVTNDDLAQPLVSSSSKQTVLFAGEATHSRYFSTVHGAIESGFREADRIVNIYKSQPIG